MRMFLFSAFAILASLTSLASSHATHSDHHSIYLEPMSRGAANGCVTFSVGTGTGCDWMCNYCANQLGTNNYYFTDGVCTYQTGGCVGSPQANTQYTCCSA